MKSKVKNSYITVFYKKIKFGNFKGKLKITEQRRQCTFVLTLAQS